MVYWTLGVVASVVGLWAGYTQFYEGNLGQPDYSVIERQDDIEFRRYTPFIVASTQLGKTGDQGLSSGFRVLAGYIFGGNQPGEKIAMTAPVLQQNTEGESLPMTAPVLVSGEGMRMAFVMPEGRSIDDLPRPNSEKVSLTTIDWGEVAALRFTGRGKQTRFQSAEVKLRERLKALDRTPSGPALYAQYNSPSAFPPLRRNEVLIPLASK